MRFRSTEFTSLDLSVALQKVPVLLIVISIEAISCHVGMRQKQTRLLLLQFFCPHPQICKASSEPWFQCWLGESMFFLHLSGATVYQPCVAQLRSYLLCPGWVPLFCQLSDQTDCLCASGVEQQQFIVRFLGDFLPKDCLQHVVCPKCERRFCQILYGTRSEKCVKNIPS